MADAYNCDRCGKFYTNVDPITVANANTRYITLVADSFSRTAKDLCPQCLVSLGTGFLANQL